MRFALQFTDRRKRLACIRAGSFAEEFAVSVDSTTSAQEEGWRRELATLFGRKKKVALPVAGRSGTISRAWILYRVGERVFIQDRLFPSGFDPTQDRVPPRETITEDGRAISEWSVSISDIDEFLRPEPNKPVQINAVDARRKSGAVIAISRSPRRV